MASEIVVWWLLPSFIQGSMLICDEFYFHRKRHIPLWERIGHPLDTLFFLVCLLFPLFFSFQLKMLKIYLILASVSCLFITKDEWVHKRLCSSGEHWIHAILFILHPVLLVETLILWLNINIQLHLKTSLPYLGFLELKKEIAITILVFQCIGTSVYLIYQIVKGVYMTSSARLTKRINNEFYHTLGERWYTAKDDPVALLRAESRLRNPWVAQSIQKHFLGKKCDILDLACGAGFLSNSLAYQGHRVTGIDISSESLEIAKLYDHTETVKYEKMDARHLEFNDDSFDVVCAMDFLEHVSEPALIFNEVSRIIRKNGLFFFHTFNRNWLSRLCVVQGVEWFVKNTPPNLHIYDLFITPSEIREFCKSAHFKIIELKGVRPCFLSRAFLKMVFMGEIDEDFKFKFSNNPVIGYSGFAVKYQNN